MKTVARSVRAPRRGTRMSAVCLWAGLLGTCPLSGEEVATGQSGNSAATARLRPRSSLTEEVFFDGAIPNQLASAPAEADPPQTRHSVELAVGGVLTHG